MARLTSRFLIDLLLRRTQAAGGFATILASGDDQSGMILIQCSDRGVAGPLLERRFSADGRYIWEEVGPSDSMDSDNRTDYQNRRRKADPDLWIVELDIVDAQRFVAEWSEVA
jgi:hypothetical protein